MVTKHRTKEQHKELAAKQLHAAATNLWHAAPFDRVDIVHQTGQVVDRLAALTRYGKAYADITRRELSELIDLIGTTYDLGPVQRKFRCTRSYPYRDIDDPGHGRASARQGYFILAASSVAALKVME